MSILKEVQKEFIIKQSIDLFLSNNIESITMSDIAKCVQIGDATLYRYFGKKQNILIKCGVALWKDFYTKISNYDKTKSGYYLITYFYNSFLDVFINNRGLYKFIYQFDSFVIKSNVSFEELKDYEDILSKISNLFHELYMKGINDGTIKEIDDIELFYLTSTHSILSLCKKLASEGEVISTDKDERKSEEVKLLINLFVKQFEKKGE